MPSFTTQISHLQNLGPIINANITISTSLEQTLSINKKSVKTQEVIAMIDTGASATVIQEDFIKKLKVHPVGARYINTPSSINVLCYEYQVKFIFPSNVSIDVVAISAPLKNQQIHCLIGRDILSQSIFIYQGHNNSFTLSF